MTQSTNSLTQEDVDFLNDWDNMTDDHEFNYLSNQHTLAHIWLKSVRKCKCKLDETTDECKHIGRALNKLYKKKMDKMFNDDLKENFTKYAKTIGLKIPYKLQKELSG